MDNIPASTSNIFLPEVISEICATFTQLPRDAVSCSGKFNRATDQSVFVALCSLKNSISVFVLQSHTSPTEDLSSVWNLKLTANCTHSNLQQLTALWFSCSTESTGEVDGVCSNQKGIKTIVLAFIALRPKAFTQKNCLAYMERF